MYNHPAPFLQAVVKISGLGYQGSLALLDIYGFIEFKLSKGIQPSIRSIAKGRATKEEVIKAKAHVLQSMGWLSFVTEDGTGTYWTLHGIPEYLPESGGDSDTDLPGSGGATSPDPGALTAPNPGAPTAPDQAVQDKKVQEVIQEGEKKRSTSSSKTKAVEEWNRLKPDGFKEISSISPSRDRSIRALGGYQAFVDQLPAFFAGAKKNPFWSKKRGISFENIIGTGVVPKSHFQELAESGAPSQDANRNSPDNMGHPDFYKPSPSGTIVARSSAVFTSMEDRQKRETEAREFYTRQQEAKR